MAESTEPRGSSEPAAPVRRLPLPASLPPYDDETGPLGHRCGQPHRNGAADASAIHGALALAVGHDAEPPESARPEPARPELRLVGESGGSTPAAYGVAPGPPDPRRWAAKLTQAALECLYGQRPVQQLTRWTDDAVYAALARRVGRRRVRSAIQPRIRAVRVCHISAAVAEATSITQLGPQTQAVAVRLEADGQRWVCTAFELVERPRPVSR